MTFYGFLPPFGGNVKSSDGTMSLNGGEYKIGEKIPVAWRLSEASDVKLWVLHDNGPESNRFQIADSWPASTNFTWTVDANALYSNSSDGHEFVFQLQIPGKYHLYTSYPFTIDGNIPTAWPTTTSSVGHGSATPTPTVPTSTVPDSTVTASATSAPPGRMETMTPQDPGLSSAAEGLIATAIVLGAAVIIGAAMAFIFRHTLTRRMRMAKKTPPTDAGQSVSAGPQTQVPMPQVAIPHKYG